MSNYGQTAVRKLNNQPSLILIKDGKEIKPIKYNKDGTVKKTKCNKQSGISSEVYAFRTKEEIEKMITVLDKHIAEAPDNDKTQIATRNKLMFVLGINLGIRASDLRTLKWSFFFEDNGEFREFYSIQPKKQRKYNKYVKLYFNDTVKKAIINYLSVYPYENVNEYLFKSRIGNDAVRESSMWRIIKDTAKEAGITQNIGSHSLRKTFGFWIWHQATDKQKALVILQRIFNHSDTSTTAKYIGITDIEFQDTFESISLGYDFL